MNTNRSTFAVLLSLSLMLATALAANKSKTIYILCLLPYPDPLSNPSWREGPAISVALDMARDEINNQTELLPDYRIELIHDDSGCEYTSKVYTSFMRHVIYSDKNVIGVVGPWCSTASLALARLTSSEGIAMVTLHGGQSPLLTDRARYPYALSSLGTSGLLIDSIVQLMVESAWTRISILFKISNVKTTQKLHPITNSSSDLRILLFYVFDVHSLLDVIFSEGLRINALFTPVETTQQILCLAFHRGMVYDAYQWIIAGNTFDEMAKPVSFTYNSEWYNCSEKEMKSNALNKTLFLNYRLSALNESAPSTYSKHSFKEYDQLFRERLHQYNSQSPPPNISYTVWSTHFYDSLWAWSAALDRLTRNHPSLDLTEYKYGDFGLSDEIVEEFHHLDFSGVSGRIEFNSSVARQISVFQVVNGKQWLVGYSAAAGFEMIGRLVYIPDQFHNIRQISDAIVITFIIIASLKFIFFVSIHVLILVYRSHPSVKASSVMLSQLLYASGYIFFAADMLLIVAGFDVLDDKSVEILCSAYSLGFLPLVFTTVISTVIIRTWRLYRIFNRFRPGRFIRDYHLAAFVLFMLFLDFVVAQIT